MKYFTLRIEPFVSNDKFEWKAYVAEIEDGKDVTSNIVLTSYGNTPLEAVSKLTVKQAQVLEGYRAKRKG